MKVSTNKILLKKWRCKWQLKNDWSLLHQSPWLTLITWQLLFLHMKIFYTLHTLPSNSVFKQKFELQPRNKLNYGQVYLARVTIYFCFQIGYILSCRKLRLLGDSYCYELLLQVFQAFRILSNSREALKGKYRISSHFNFKLKVSSLCRTAYQVSLHNFM